MSRPGVRSAPLGKGRARKFSLADARFAAAAHPAARAAGWAAPSGHHLLSCLGKWRLRVLSLRADYLAEHRPSQHRLVTSDSSTRYTAQASVGAGFNEIARRSGLATTARKVEPRDVTRYVARQVLLETGQISEVARWLGLSSLDNAAELAGLTWKTSEAPR
ncbi:hypothetical protein [Streptomyces sp. NPDC003952]